MSLELNEKIERAIGFLIAFGGRRVMGAMRLTGFSPADLKLGWELAQTAAMPWLESPPEMGDTPETRKALGELDGWENEFFPVIDATLVRRYPEIHRKVLGGLSQTSGPALLLTIPKLLANIKALEEAGDAKSREARALLAERGLTTAVVDHAQALVELASAANMTPAPISDEELERRRVEREQNVERLWDWYVEWSTIARARVKNGQVLYQMGFGRPGRPKHDEVAKDPTPQTDPTKPVA